MAAQNDLAVARAYAGLPSTMSDYQSLSLIIDTSSSEEPITPMTSDDELPDEMPQLRRWHRVTCHVHGGPHHTNDSILYRARICTSCKVKLFASVVARDNRVREKNILDARAILPSFCDFNSVGSIVVDYL